jgi:hypothetical protein
MDVLKEVEDFFGIDITERGNDYLIKVTRKSDGRDMALTMAICEFVQYMDWWYGIEARYDEGGCVVAKECGIEEMRLHMRMYLYEHRKIFLMGTEGENDLH